MACIAYRNIQRVDRTTSNRLMPMPVRGESHDKYKRIGTFQLIGEHACTWFEDCLEKIIAIVRTDKNQYLVLEDLYVTLHMIHFNWSSDDG